MNKKNSSRRQGWVDRWQSVIEWKEQPSVKVAFYAVISALGYGLAVSAYFTIVSAMGGEATLSGAVDVMKLASFSVILWAGGEFVWREQDLSSLSPFVSDTVFRNIRRLLLALVVFVLVGMVVKFGISKGIVLLSDAWKDTWISWFLDALPYLATFPIFSYAIFHFAIAVSRPKNFGSMSSREVQSIWRMKKAASRYCVISSLPAIVSLAWLFCLLSLENFDASKYDKNLFLSGAIVVVLITGSITAKAVEEYYDFGE
ncbi:hypothetical protein [uncultured Tateyamaria sp.]|uniref:hypothetical protein n=1 Tax=uncultured Tateyamaria sp. TaxID=455651 RepID=UPI00261A53E2|nr:hypothetical protein [uncultured Tateyamaria sp.]